MLTIHCEVMLHAQVSTKLSVELLEDPHEKDVQELAAMLGLRKVKEREEEKEGGREGGRRVRDLFVSMV